MFGRFGMAALAALMTLAGATAASAASEGRFYVQVRNVTPGNEMRIEITNPRVLNLLVADIRLSGVAKTLADDEVAVEGNVLVVRTAKPRLNVNLTVHAICQGSCPEVLFGRVAVPRASYAMVRTRAEDATLTKSGEWQVRLASPAIEG